MGLLMLLMPLASLVSFIGFVWLVRNAFRSGTGWGLAVLFLSPISAIVYAVKFWNESKKPFLVYCGGAAGGLVMMVMMFGALGGFQAVQMANAMSNGELDEAQAEEFINGQIDRIESAGMLDSQGQADLERIKSAMSEMTAEAQDAADAEAVDEAPMTGDEVTDADAEPRGSIADPELERAETEEALAAAMRVRTNAVVSENREVPSGPVRVQDASRYVGERVLAVGTDGLEHRGRLASVDAGSIWLEQNFSGGTFQLELKRSQIRTLEIEN